MWLGSQHWTEILSGSCCSAQGHLLPSTFFLLEICTVSGVLVTPKSYCLWFLSWRLHSYSVCSSEVLLYSVFSLELFFRAIRHSLKKLPAVLNQISLSGLLYQNTLESNLEREELFQLCYHRKFFRHLQGEQLVFKQLDCRSVAHSVRLHTHVLILRNTTWNTWMVDLDACVRKF